MKTELFRISAVLYEDTYGVKEKSLKKLAMILFLINENKNLTIREIKEHFKNEYQLIFGENELFSIVNDDSVFVKTKIKNTSLFCLNEDIYLSQKGLYYEDKILKYLDEYFQKYTNVSGNKIDFSEFKNLILEYLYEIYNSEKIELEILFCAKKWNLNSKSYTEEQVRLINGFFEWDNEDKNFEIYKISSLALEYFLITSNYNSKEVNQLFSNKKFYLDTNVFIKLLGTDGAYSAYQTQNFLSKMSEKGVKFCLTSYIVEEYNNLISSMSKKLRNFVNGGSIVSPESLEGQIDDSFLGFYRLFYTWFKEKGTKNIDLFRSSIEVFLDETIENYGMAIEEISDLDIENRNIREMLETLCRYKRREFDICNIDQSVYVDVSSIANLESKRTKRNQTISDEEYFMVTFDTFFLGWYRKTRKYTVPIITKPSTWITLSLKFDSRATKTDYASFVSYLTKAIPNTEKVAIEKNKIILKEILKYTDLAVEQKRILKNTINKIGVSIINDKKDDELEFEVSSVVMSEYKSIIDEKVENVESTARNVIDSKDKEIKTLNDKIEKNTDEISKLSQIYTKETEEKEKYKHFYLRFWKFLKITLYSLGIIMIALSLFLMAFQLNIDKQGLFPINDFGLYLANNNKYIIFLVYLIPMNFFAGLIFKYGIKWVNTKLETLHESGQ